MKIKGRIVAQSVELIPMTVAEAAALPDQRQGLMVNVSDGAGTKVSVHDGTQFNDPSPTGQEFQQSQQSNQPIDGGSF